MTPETIAIVVQVVSFLILGIGIYFKSYLTKKGENVATKEDVSNITHQIENVKHQFAIDLESNRVLLSKNLQKNNLFLDERTKRILELYDAIMMFRMKNIAFNPWDHLSDDWNQTFKELHEDTFKAYHDVNIKFHICSIFLKNHPELFQSTHRVVEEVGRLFRVYKTCYITVKLAFLKEVKAMETPEDGESIKSAVMASNTIGDLYDEERDLQKFNKAMENFIGELTEFFGDY